MNFDVLSFGGLMQRHVGWLTGSGVPMSATIRSEPVRPDYYQAARGRVASRR
ncbi:hypothetical protein GGE56_002900 [Rhizobium leguminosarum]|nr:hypothetical protein [Rhizobium leguminosarum]MBB6294606.1 hypothetical protein [Rhizobium leguminosarum]